MPKRYPDALRRKARKLVRAGVPKCEVAGMLGISGMTLCIWTKDMPHAKGNRGVRGRSLELMGLLVRRGYVTSDEVKQSVCCMRTIAKYLPVRRVGVGRVRVTTVWLLPGREREAMEGYLKLAEKHSIGYEELGMIRKTFGIKSIKRNNRIEGFSNAKLLP